MRIQFVTPATRKERLLADVELHFEKDEPLAGLKLVGFCLWRKPQGAVDDVYVTLPGRAYGGGYGTHTGTVDRIFPDRGFGFISRRNGPDVFVHVSEAACELKEGDKVRFEIKAGEKGPSAHDVVRQRGYFDYLRSNREEYSDTDAIRTGIIDAWMKLQ